jgi:hypothetical protein
VIAGGMAERPPRRRCADPRILAPADEGPDAEWLSQAPAHQATPCVRRSKRTNENKRRTYVRVCRSWCKVYVQTGVCVRCTANVRCSVGLYVILARACARWQQRNHTKSMRSQSLTTVCRLSRALGTLMVSLWGFGCALCFSSLSLLHQDRSHVPEHCTGALTALSLNLTHCLGPPSAPTPCCAAWPPPLRTPSPAHRTLHRRSMPHHRVRDEHITWRTSDVAEKQKLPREGHSGEFGVREFASVLR